MGERFLNRAPEAGLALAIASVALLVCGEVAASAVLSGTNVFLVIAYRSRRPGL